MHAVSRFSSKPETRYYEVRIATDLSSTARTGFLGIDGYVKVDYKVKP